MSKIERNYEITEQEVITKNIFNEEDEKMVDHLIHKMLGLSDDVELDDNLKKTSSRYLKVLSYMSEGYRTNPADYLDTVFPVNSPNLADDEEDFDESRTDVIYKNGIVMVSTDIWSLCCHHVCPFKTKCYIFYVPSQKIVGLSKIVRMAKMFGRRLSLQEQLANNICDSIMNKLQPLGAAVYMCNSVHSCVQMRGVAENTSQTDSITVRGIFATNPDAKAEILTMVSNAEKNR